MGELIKSEEISNSQLEQNLGFDLDPAHYFESLLLKATQIGLVSEKSSTKLQTNLFKLLKKQINRYTSFESTSIQI